MARRTITLKILSVKYKDCQLLIETDIRTTMAHFLKQQKKIESFLPFMGTIREEGMANTFRRTYPWPYTKTGRISKRYSKTVYHTKMCEMLDHFVGEVVDSIMEDARSGALRGMPIGPGMLLVVRRKKKPSQPSEGGGNG